MKNDIYFMKMALREAQKAYDKNEVPIGAIIVKDNKIIGKGYNLKETKNNPLKHAELIAIEKATKKINNWRLIDCTIYITMFPCPMCASAINQSRISKIVYGCIPEYVDKDLINKIVNDNKYGNSIKFVDNLLENECSKLIKKFFLKKR